MHRMSPLVKQFKRANGRFGIDEFGWWCRRGAGRIVAIFVVFIVTARRLNLNMTAPVTPDAGGSQGRTDDRSNARSAHSLNAAANIFEISRYGTFCAHASTLIVESLDVISDKSSSATKKKQAEAAMRMLAEKLADIDTAMLSVAAKSNAKIPAARKAIEKIRQDEARSPAEVDDVPASKRHKKTVAQTKVEEFNVFPDVETGDFTSAVSILELSPSAQVPSVRVSPRTSVIPAPTSASGTFSPKEVMTMLLGLPDRKKNYEARKLMVEKGWVKYKDGDEMKVMGEAGLRTFWRKWRDSSLPPPDQFGRHGKPSFMRIDDLIEQVRAQLHVQEDSSVCRDDVTDLIIKAREKSLTAAGLDIRGLDLRPTDETLNAYFSALAMKGGFKLAGSVRDMANHRTVAVNSSRNCMSNCLVAAVAQSIKVPAVPVDRELSSEASDGAKKLMQLVRAAEGTDNIVPVIADLVTSRDTVSFQATANGTDDSDEFRITLQEYTGKVHSVHSSGESSSEQFRGVNIHADTLITGGGRLAPILLSVKKVKPSELPVDKCPEGFVFVPVSNMAPGSDTNVSSEGAGYVAFIREGESIDTDLFKHHWKCIQGPFLKDLRKDAAPDVSEEGQRVDPLLRSVNWHDGGMPSLFAVSSEELLIDMAMKEEVDVKHPFGTSLIFQPSDVASSYRSLKKDVNQKGSRKRKRSSDHVGASGTKAANLFKAALREAKRECGLNLNPNREKSLIVLVGRIAGHLGRAFTSGVIIQSFVEAGLLDSGAKQYPDMFKILNNKKSPLQAGLIDEYFIPHFTEMYLEVKRTGEVSEATFDRIDALTGIDTKDRDEKGIVVERTATIRNEWRQRAKIVSHEEQRKLRREEDDAAAQQAAVDHAREREDRKAIRNLAVLAELKLIAELGDAWKSRSNGDIAGALEKRDPNNPSKHLFSASEVEALVKVRCWNSCKMTRSRPRIASRKGDAAKAKECLRLRPGGNGAAPLGQNFCTIYQVLLYRNDAWKLAELPEEAPTPTAGRRAAERRHPVVIDVVTEEDEKLPSAFLEDDAFIDAVEKGDLLGADFVNAEVTDELKENADALLVLLKNRLCWRKTMRLQPEKRDQWPIKGFETNLAALAAIDVKGGRVVDDLKSSDDETCYLRDPLVANFLEVKEGNATAVHGNYNRFDSRRRRFVRSGFEYDEESNRDLVVRVEEHKEAAKLRRDSDKKKPHYRLFPHKESAHLVPNVERKGYSHDLESFVGIGFKNESSGTLTSDAGDGGLFVWDDEVVKGLEAASDGCTTLESKKRKLVAYWFELLDDLKIPLKYNVSESFGMETYLKNFG